MKVFQLSTIIAILAWNLIIKEQDFHDNDSENSKVCEILKKHWYSIYTM